MDARTDAALLKATAREPEAFGVFYRRHVRAVLAYLLARTRSPELAADLCAEVFAAALESAQQYEARRGPARAWLFGIAGNRLIDSLRRGRVEDGARQRLGIEPRELTDADLERVEELGSGVEALVGDLPPDQRAAVLARVVEEREYADIAAQLSVSQSVVRQRVSRGLATLRARLEEADA